jgi:hypothetical protein
VRTFVDDPVICELSFRKWETSRRNSLRFIPSINDVGTKRSSPNSLLWNDKKKRGNEISGDFYRVKQSGKNKWRILQVVWEIAFMYEKTE